MTAISEVKTPRNTLRSSDNRETPGGSNFKLLTSKTLADCAFAIEKSHVLRVSSRKGSDHVQESTATKSRFHRERKQKFARRIRNQKLFAGLVAPKAAAAPALKKRSQGVGMSAPTLTTWSLANPAAAALKKKRVLLIDTSRAKRDLRSETMRKLGVDVDCAADISEARCWWRADLYDLVLIHVDDPTAPRDKFCDDMRSATPPQQIMFLVGKPEYLATAPGADADLATAFAGRRQRRRAGHLERCENRADRRN